MNKKHQRSFFVLFVIVCLFFNTGVRPVSGGSKQDPLQTNVNSLPVHFALEEAQRPAKIPQSTGRPVPSGSTPGWNTLMTENFESEFPSAGWRAYDGNGRVNGEYFWGKADFKPYLGSWSAWPARGGADGLDPRATGSYPSNMVSWMVYGPFNLTDTTAANLQFYYWNQSEAGYDFLSWLASIDGVNFYGDASHSTSGNSPAWTLENFDLTNVPTLGNLTGKSAVWIAFRFTSDFQNTDTGPFIDNILLQAFVPTTQPDITPHTPDGWSDAIVPASYAGTTTLTSLYSYLETYIDWAIINTGASTPATFSSCLFLDDAQLNCWPSSSLPANSVTSITDWVMTVKPTAGSHTLKLVSDIYNEVTEFDESNNTYEKAFFWEAPTQPDFTPFTPTSWMYPVVPSSVSNTNTVDTLYTARTYIDWAINNTGISTTTPFDTCLYFDGTPINCWRNDGLQQNASLLLPDWILNLTPTPGSHTLRLVADALDAVPEANEDNNSWEYSFTWNQTCYSLTTATNPPYAGSISVQTAPNCQSGYYPGDFVSLTATANAGYRFAGWSGDLGGTSSPTTITMTADRVVTASFSNRSPTLAGISPSSTAAGGSALTLTLTGTDFVQNSVARWGSSNLATTYLSNTQLTASIPAELIANAGSVNISVFNSAPGGGTSGTRTFRINNPLPVVASLAPPEITTGSAAFTLTISGSGFVTSSAVRWNGNNLITTYVDGTTLNAAVPANLIANSGTTSVTVFNPTPGGGTSKALAFSINNPIPVAASLNPSGAMAGSGAISLSINGQGFVSTSKARWNGSDLATTLVSGSQLTAFVPASLIAAAGTASVTVINPAPAGGTSTALIFAIYNPQPVAGSLNPANVTAGSDSVPLTISGSGFVNASVVRWNNTDLSTTYTSGTQVLATIPASLLAKAGTASVTIFNPEPGGGTSAALPFTIDNPIPAINSLDPPSAIAGEVAFTLTVSGTNFVNTSIVRWNGNDLATNYVSAIRLNAAIPASLITDAGPASVTVFNPAPGGGASEALILTINNPRPAISVIEPKSIFRGAHGLKLTIKGSGFGSGAVVYWNENALFTTRIDRQTLIAEVPDSYLADNITVTIAVRNPAPGGGFSDGMEFVVASYAVYLPVTLK